MASTRFFYDPCRVEKQLQESTDQGINVADNNNSDGKFERIINDMFWSDEFDTDAIDEEFSGNFGTYTFSIEKDDNTSILNVIKHMESLGWITFMDYNYQKKFLTEQPENFKDLEQYGILPEIREEFDYLFNADNMGLF